MYDYDLLVIGAGSGGVRAARMAAGFGARVAVVEDRYLGGTCVNVGCVPKKLYVYAAEYRGHFQDSEGFGWSTDTPLFDWATLRDNKKTEIQRLNNVYRSMLENAGCTLIDGRASLIDAHTAVVGDQHLRAEKILIATGGWPSIPDIPGKQHVLSSNEIFDLENFPERLLIVGGGYIAVEFASIFAGLGAETIQLYRGPLFLRGFDQDLRRHLAQEMPKKGVDLRFNLNIETVEKSADGSLRATLTDGSEITADVILYATGRQPNLAGLGLEHTNITLNAEGGIAVDQHFRTQEPSIFALGDVTGGMELTPVALAEGMAFARREFAGMETDVDYDNIPTAVFSQPNIGTVGITEEQARARFGNDDIVIYKSDFRPMKHTISGRDERTLMKLVVQRSTDKVLGAHMVGPDAGEIIQGMAVALKAGATKSVFDATIGIHPTAAEEFVTMRQPWREAGGA